MIPPSIIVGNTSLYILGGNMTEISKGSQSLKIHPTYKNKNP